MERSEAFVEELKLVTRCLALCGVKHAIGDFFTIDLTWPSPIHDHASFLELANQPGVYQVTMDTKTGPQSPGTPGEEAPLFRHMILTNIPWMWQLSRDIGTAAYAPTFSWDWKKQPMRVPMYGPEFTRKYADAVAEFV